MEKFLTILAINEIDDATINGARRSFSAYREKNIITDGCFEDDKWALCDEYANYHLDYSLKNVDYVEFGNYLKLSKSEYQKYMKTFVMCQMGDLSIVSLQILVNLMKKVAICFKKDINEIFETKMNYLRAPRLLDFFSMLPNEGREKEQKDLIEKIEDAIEKVHFDDGNQRFLVSFESYFKFDEIIKRYWRESDDEDEKLFFFPIWFWWNISGILPLRPREILLTPRDCLTEVNGKYYLTIRRNKIKGSQKTKSYRLNDDYKFMKYEITEELARDIKWYLDKTIDCNNTDLYTLFITAKHYLKWERSAPYSSRFFTYVNFSTCLRYFYNEIIIDRYGYNVVFDSKDDSVLDEGEIEYLHLGDTRHIALINMIAEGATPVVAMLLAGHDNMDMTSHYFSNISRLIECRTYRQYKKLINGKQLYELSTPHTAMKVKEFTVLKDKSRCYSMKVKNDDFSDCFRVIGPSGEIGFCHNCKFHYEDGRTFNDAGEIYNNRINNECKMLEEIVKKVRCGKGEPEEIISILLRLRDTSYSYQQYLLEKMEAENGKKKNN